jgi:translation initiation factor 4E
MFMRDQGLLDRAWSNLSMALIGEMLDSADEVCGIVVSTRPKADRLQIWTRGAEDATQLNALAKRILDTLDFDTWEMEQFSLDFHANSPATKAPPELISMQPASALAAGRAVSYGIPRRGPLSPNGGNVPLPQMPPHLAPFNAASHAMRRTGSAGASAFSGPLGSAR